VVWTPPLPRDLIDQEPHDLISVQRFRGELVFKTHRLCVSLNYKLEINKEEEEAWLYHSTKTVHKDIRKAI